MTMPKIAALPVHLHCHCGEISPLCFWPFVYHHYYHRHYHHHQMGRFKGDLKDHHGWLPLGHQISHESRTSLVRLMRFWSPQPHHLIDIHHHLHHYHRHPYLIFVLFSPQTKFLAQFFSTPKRANSDKTDFATKQRKLHKREILQQNIKNCTYYLFCTQYFDLKQNL